jgi:hypothetical protein
LCHFHNGLRLKLTFCLRGAGQILLRHFLRPIPTITLSCWVTWHLTFYRECVSSASRTN